ncbi:MAG: peptidylprolyl isomerase [Gammaproteobacteria bacterium]|nr:peptidylprolyl isomerase [Pseudomonadales bacterium]MCP5347119.1 peptidylprolyl isomerase [Pseudomonadales bacterium]
MNRQTFRSIDWQRAAALLLTLCLAAVSLSVQAQRVSLDKVIAIVDDDVILQSELNSRLADIAAQARQTNRPLPPMEDLREEVLDILVLESIQLQMAERASIRFDDDTLNRVMGNLAQQNNMTFDQYVSNLQAAGVYRQTREQIRRELTLQELQRGMVNRRINITDQEIENFLNSEMGRTTMAPDYLVQDLLIAIREGDSRQVIEDKLQFASHLVSMAESGVDFQDVMAEARLNRQYQANNTSLGWRRLEQIPSLFAELLPDMKVGEVAGPVRAGNGFHIIELADLRGGTDRIVNQTHIRHIMISPNEIRTEDQARAQVERLRERILAGEDFETLARQNSDDASSVVAGGDLDWVNEGGMPPEMEMTVNQLEIGEISEPFRTGTGWHIAEVLGRREQDLSRQFSRAQAENALRNRKYDLELQNWLLEIRESAFVEFKE